MSDEPQPAASIPQNQPASATIMDFFIKIPPIVKKLFLIVGALLIFQIPLLLLTDLVREREDSYKMVQHDIASAWGEINPLIPVPFCGGLLPDDYQVSAELFPEVRYRGIYQTVVFKTNVQMDMIFNVKPREKQKPQGIWHKEVKKEEKPGPRVVLPKASALNVVVTVDGKKVAVKKMSTGYDFELPPSDSGKVKCRITYSLMGAQSIQFASYGELAVKGTWGAPGFEGVILPAERYIENNFFKAKWNFEQHMYKNTVVTKLHLPGSDYASVLRLLCYGTFFLIIFFVAFLAAECFCKVSVHSVQYLVSALTPVLFYLMLLAFTEKCGFLASYIISTAIVLSLTVFYVRMIFARFKPALILGGVFGAAYALNYVILKMENMALITGTIVLIAILAFIMFLTGKLNRK